MNITLPYIIEVSVCLCGFYSLYFLLLRHFTFFSANRYYLLAGSIISFVIPLLSIPVFSNHYNFVVKSVYDLPAGYSESFSFVTDGPATQSILSNSILIWWIYALGALFFLVRLLISLRRIVVLSTSGLPEKYNRYTIIRLKDIQPFSFGRWIFLPKGYVHPMIVEHERLHIVQWHWVDLMTIEIVKCALWFNPVVYFYKRAIQLQHEYLADQGTLQSHNKLEDYMRAVMTQLRVNTVPMPVNRFHSLSIKKRILMMTQKQTSHFRAIWYVLVLPVVACMLFAFAFTSNDKIKPRPQFQSVKSVSIVPTAQDNIPTLFPVDISQLKSVVCYGERMHPIFKEMKMHTGLDFVMAEGSDIVATADGFILEAAYDGAHGNYIIIKHGDTYRTRYSHMKGLVVKAGQNVKAGETIGHVGSTGISTGPHLHYEVYEKNKQVDPKGFMPKLGC